MTQTVPATAALGPGKTGLAIGLRVLNLDGTTYGAFATTGVSETSVAGTYRKASGVVCPDAGAYIVWGVSGTDYAESTVEPATAGGGLTAQETTNAVHNLAPAGTPAANSIGAHLDTLITTTSAIKVTTDQLDVSAVTQVAASNAGHLTITAGLTFSESVTGLTIPADWVAAVWTLKRNVRDTDLAALVQLRTTNPAAGSDGLQRLNGAAPASPITVASGTLTVNQAGGSITTNLTDELTVLLAAATDLGWDVKFIDVAGDSTGRRGTAAVVLTETKATA